MGRYKALFWILGSLAALLFCCFALLPTLLSTEWGTAHFVSWFNHSHSGTLSIQQMQLSWLGKQQIDGVLYTNQKGETLLSLKKLETNNSLLYFLLGGNKLQNTVIEEPYYAWDTGAWETHAPSPSYFSKRLLHFLHFHNELTIDKGTFFLLSPHMSPIKIADLRIHAHDHNQYQIHATTLQGELVGSIDLECAYQDTLICSGKVSQFPLAVLDELTHTSWYTDLIGKKIDIAFSFSKQSDGQIAFSATVAADQVQGTFQGHADRDNLYLEAPNTLTVTLKPKVVADLLPEKQRAVWTMASPTELSIDIFKGTFPLSFQPNYQQKMVVHAAGKLDRLEIHHATLSSYSLNHLTFTLMADGNLELAYKGAIQGKESSDISGNVSINTKNELSFQANCRGFPVHLVNLLSPPLADHLYTLLGNNFDVEGVGMYHNKTLESQITLHSDEMRIETTLTGEPKRPFFEINGHKKLSGTLKEQLGDELLFHGTGLVVLSTTKPALPLFDGELSTRLGTVTLHGTLHPPVKEGGEAPFSFTAKGRINGFPLPYHPPGWLLEEGNFSLALEGSTQKLVGEARAEMAFKTDEGVFHRSTLTLEGALSHFFKEGELDLPDATFTFQTKGTPFSPALLNPWISKNLNLTTLIGKEVNLEAAGGYNPKEAWHVTVKAESPELQIEGALNIDSEQGIREAAPLTLQWKMSPEQYLHLMTLIHPGQIPRLRLTKPARYTLSIDQLHCPIRSSDPLFCHVGFVGKMTLSPLSFRDYENQTYFILNNLVASIQGEQLSQSIDFQAGGTILAQNIPRSEESKFSFSGSILSLCTEEKWSPEKASLTGSLQLDLLPVQPLTDLLLPDETSRTLVQAVLGEFVTTHISGSLSQLSGHAMLAINASNLKANVPIRITPHAIYLSDRIEAELTLTDAVNETILKDVNPIITGAYSDHPIRLTIEPKGFVLPIRPYTFAAIQIEQATLDLGKLMVQHGEQLRLLTTFLKSEHETPGELTAWFTPIFFHINKGISTYERFDVLLGDNVHVAFWGSINLLTHQVKMILGIDPTTLQKHLNIAGLSKKDLFQVKMRGTTNRLELDWSSAYTRIGILMAKHTKNAVGAIVGEILSQISASLGEEPPPPPTTDPLPWEKGAHP